MATAISARDLVHCRLARLARVYPELPPVALTHDDAEAQGLPPRDAALAVAIEQSVVRYWSALVAVLQMHLTRPWSNTEPKLQAALLSGAAQLLLLDRVPDHAAINESVQWAKSNIRPKAGGLVNALLRKVVATRGGYDDAFDQSSRSHLPLPDGRVIAFTDNVFAAEHVERLAQQTSHPVELIRTWTKQFDRVTATDLALHSLVQAPTIVVGLDSAPPQFEDVLAPHSDAGCFVFTGSRAQLTELLSAHQESRVQDPSAARPVQRTAELRPALVIDYCAGLGTKTRQLAALHGRAQIVATDVNDHRRAQLRRQFADHDRVTVIEPADVGRYARKADLLVLDVPCSNTGVLARRLEAKHRWSTESVAKLVALQRQIVADALPLLADSGHLLYCTCSIDSAENEEQLKWLIKWHDFNVSEDERWLPAAQPGDRPATYRDGSFAALLRR